MTATPSRRQLLSAAALLPVAACTSSEDRPERPDPDDAIRAAALHRELALIHLYDRALSRARPRDVPALRAVRADHLAHHLALGKPAPSTRIIVPIPSVLPSTASMLPLRLVEQERIAAAAHAADALKASADLAMLLASLAASEASHPVALP